MQTKFQFLGLLVLLTLLSIGVFAQDAMSETVQVTTVHVETHLSQGDVRDIEGATATLMASEAGVFVHMQTAELEEGHVYTMWVVIVNNPEACETSPCAPSDILGNSDAVQSEVTWGDSVLYSNEARMEFAAFLPTGDVVEPWFGNGITNPLEAEIHLIINDHGEVVSEMTATMLNTYRGGCTDESLPPPFPETATSDGEPGPNTCRLVQGAIFAQ